MGCSVVRTLISDLDGMTVYWIDGIHLGRVGLLEEMCGSKYKCFTQFCLQLMLCPVLGGPRLDKFITCGDSCLHEQAGKHPLGNFHKGRLLVSCGWGLCASPGLWAAAWGWAAQLALTVRHTEVQ